MKYQLQAKEGKTSVLQRDRQKINGVCSVARICEMKPEQRWLSASDEKSESAIFHTSATMELMKLLISSSLNEPSPSDSIDFIVARFTVLENEAKNTNFMVSDFHVSRLLLH